MSTDALAADEPSGTTEAPTDDKRVLDLDDVEPASVPGATVIFAPTYTRTDDGAALRYDGDVPIAAVGVYSKHDARDALAECYAAENIDRAFRVGEWMSREKQALATEAVSHAESGVVTDGGEDEDGPGTTTVSGCATCSGYAYGGDEQCPECQQRGVEPIEDTPL